MFRPFFKKNSERFFLLDLYQKLKNTSDTKEFLSYAQELKKELALKGGARYQIEHQKLIKEIKKVQQENKSLNAPLAEIVKPCVLFVQLVQKEMEKIIFPPMTKGEFISLVGKIKNLQIFFSLSSNTPLSQLKEWTQTEKFKQMKPEQLITSLDFLEALSEQAKNEIGFYMKDNASREFERQDDAYLILCYGKAKAQIYNEFLLGNLPAEMWFYIFNYLTSSPQFLNRLAMTCVFFSDLVSAFRVNIQEELDCNLPLLHLAVHKKMDPEFNMSTLTLLDKNLVAIANHSNKIYFGNFLSNGDFAQSYVCELAEARSVKKIIASTEPNQLAVIIEGECREKSCSSSDQSINLIMLQNVRGVVQQKVISQKNIWGDSGWESSANIAVINGRYILTQSNMLFSLKYFDLKKNQRGDLSDEKLFCISNAGEVITISSPKQISGRSKALPKLSIRNKSLKVLRDSCVETASEVVGLKCLEDKILIFTISSAFAIYVGIQVYDLKTLKLEGKYNFKSEDIMFFLHYNYSFPLKWMVANDALVTSYLNALFFSGLAKNQLKTAAAEVSHGCFLEAKLVTEHQEVHHNFIQEPKFSGDFWGEGQSSEDCTFSHGSKFSAQGVFLCHDYMVSYSHSQIIILPFYHSAIANHSRSVFAMLDCVYQRQYLSFAFKMKLTDLAKYYSCLCTSLNFSHDYSVTKENFSLLDYAISIVSEEQSYYVDPQAEKRRDEYYLLANFFIAKNVISYCRSDSIFSLSLLDDKAQSSLTHSEKFIKLFEQLAGLGLLINFKFNEVGLLCKLNLKHALFIGCTFCNGMTRQVMPITRETPGCEYAITNLEELKEAILQGAIPSIKLGKIKKILETYAEVFSNEQIYQDVLKVVNSYAMLSSLKLGCGLFVMNYKNQYDGEMLLEELKSEFCLMKL